MDSGDVSVMESEYQQQQTISSNEVSEDKQSVDEIKASNDNEESTSKPKILEKEYVTKFNTNIDRFHYICKDLPSPNIFIDFSFYFMISACLARKVWIGGEPDSLTRNIYANLFLIYVADPGIGKSMSANVAHNLIKNLTETRLDKKTNQYYVTKLLNLGPDAISFEKLILRAHGASDIIKDINKRAYHHSSTTFCIEDEMGMLFYDNTKRVVYFLTKAWDCGDYEDDYVKRGELLIKNICVNFLGCCPPRMLRDLIKTKILDDGFTARILAIYADKKRFTPTKISTSRDQINEGKVIQKHLRKLATLPPQEIHYTKDAYDWLHDWTQNKLDKHLNDHPRLKDYYGRRQHHLIKMAMNVHYSENLEPYIEVPDFIEAEKLLLRVEERMHLALVNDTENPGYNVAQEILRYLKENGPTTKITLKIKFAGMPNFELSRFDDIFDFLVQTEQCNVTTLKGKPALCLITKPTK